MSFYLLLMLVRTQGRSIMTKEEFTGSYCMRSGITREFFDHNLVVLSCSCDYEDCNGWAAVCNDRLSIESHEGIYLGVPYHLT